MADNALRKARRYPQLPVWVVEDHNDVLPHIYRAIASRHLPFQGITMLHFDSHPDLQIATEMDADIVFDKFELFSSVSIENWIVPAVYAGHINHVVWIKPPWADQLPEGSRRVFVGKHRESKKLRITWPDSYFLSDLLYASQDDLECSKELTVDVVTMEMDLLQINPKAASLAHQSHATLENDEIETNCQLESRNLCRKTTADQIPRCINQGTSDGCSCCGQMNIPKVSMCHSSSGNTVLKIEQHLCEYCESTKERTLMSGANVESVDAVSREKERTGVGENQQVSTGEPCSVHDVVSAAIENSTGTVLDIDLDFFSTRNPFKEIYPESLFHQLEDLYSFKGPVDDSQSALRECMGKRAEQLAQLETAIRLAVDGEEKSDAVSDERFHKVKSFVAALRAAGCDDVEPLDAEMIHMAGLTCDDSGELPHHVSTEEEIDSLVVAMETLLSQLPKPVMVTVARSSHDDYCPPEQVGQIQQKVIKMLQNVYGKLDVHLDYKDQVDSAEST